MTSPKRSQRIHIVIPDTQVSSDVPTDHLSWAGQFIVDEYAGTDLAIIHLGDHWDMPSLSSYDKGKKTMEGRRVKKDVQAGNKAFRLLDAPLAKCSTKTSWKPEKHFLFGNHEDRITRACEIDAQIDGLLTLEALDTLDWKRHAFLKPLHLDGIAYAHYFYVPNTGRPYGGMAETRLKQLGRSFTQGHQQGLQMAQRSVLGKRTRALIAGSFYQHSEEYRGPQASDEWRGILVKHNVNAGDYDLSEVSLGYLKKRYG